MKRKKKSFFYNKKFILPIAVFFLIVIPAGAVIATKIKLRQKSTLNKDVRLDNLLKQLDQALESLKKKSEVTILSAKKDMLIDVNTICVNGIIWNVENPIALVNNQIVQLGNEIENYQIVGIQPTSITLKNKDGVVTVIDLYENKQTGQNKFPQK